MTASAPGLSDLPLSCPPVLDPGFLPAVLWNKAYRTLADELSGSRQLDLALARRS